jgi:hypothetical protein
MQTERQSFNQPNENERARKHSIKDFDQLDFMNKTQLRDPILDQFLSKAKEMERHAGLPKVRSPKKT